MPQDVRFGFADGEDSGPFLPSESRLTKEIDSLLVKCGHLAERERLMALRKEVENVRLGSLGQAIR